MQLRENIEKAKQLFLENGLLPNHPKNFQIDLWRVMEAKQLLTKEIGGGFSLMHYVAAVRDHKILHVFLRQSRDVNVRDQWGYTPAHYAAAFGFKTTLKTLGNARADLTLISDAGHSLIHCAAASSFNSLNMLEFLLEKGLDPECVDQAGNKAIDYCEILAARNYLERVTRKHSFLEEAPQPIPDEILSYLPMESLQSLMLVNKNHARIVRGFFSNNIKSIRFDPNFSAQINDQQGLMNRGFEWARNKGHPAAVQAFLNSGATFKSDGGEEIKNALASGKHKVVRALAMSGAKLDTDQEFPCEEILDYLMEYGTTEELKQQWDSCMDYDKDRMLEEIFERCDWMTIELFVNNCLNGEEGKVRIRQVFSDAMHFGRFRSVDMLLRYANVDPNQQTNFEKYPIFLAIWTKNPSHVELLLNHGADPNQKDGDNCSPLAFAAIARCVEIVKLLLKKGANPFNEHVPLFAGDIKSLIHDARVSFIKEGKINKEQYKDCLACAVDEKNSNLLKLLLEYGVTLGVDVQNPVSESGVRLN